jgi:PAS domain S-box-containing protein
MLRDSVMGDHDRTPAPPGVLDDLPDVVYERDLLGRITAINAAGERLLGQPRACIVGRTLHAAHPDAMGSLKATNERLLASGEDRSTVVLRDAAGEERTLESVTTLLRDESGAPCGARGVMRDVTERVRLENELLRHAQELAIANEALRAADAVKSRLVSMLVHDLRGPLTVVTATLDVLDSRGEVRELLDIARRSSNDMARLIDEALELYRPGGATPLQRASVAVDVMLSEPLEGASLVARRRRISVEQQIEDALPFVDVDADRMRRVVSNLLSNAVKFSPEGGRILVSARAVCGGTHVEIAVEDEGAGVAPEDLPHLFDPYYQARGPLARGGTGLGLAIVRRLLQAHGGDIAVEAASGHGARFVFRLPASTSEPPLARC